MAQPGLAEIERRARNLAREHMLEKYFLTSFGKPDSIYSYVQQDEKGYHFITPTGEDPPLEVQTTQDADEVLYWVICDATMRTAFDKILSDPGGPRDPAAWRDRDLEMLGRISPQWQKRRKMELDESLGNE